MAIATLAPAAFTPLKSRFSTIRTGLKKATTDLGRSSKLLFRKTRVKAESIRLRKSFFARREEGIRRREKEGQLEAAKVGTGRRRGGNPLADLGKGLLERIMDTLGTFLVGWLVYNLPTIMTMAQNLIGRIKIAGSVITGFFGNVIKIFTGTGKVAGAMLQNIVSLDIFDTNKRVRTAFSELTGTFDDLESNIKTGIDLVTKPLGQLPGEKEVPRTGTDYTTPAGGPGAPSTSGYGTKEQQALLKTIRYAEGTAGSTGYSMFFGDREGQAKYGDLTKLSANEVEKLVTKFLQDPQSRFRGGKSAAVGAYQIIDITAKARSLGMDMNRKFDQSFQDEMALRLAASRGVSAEVLKREGLSDTVIKKLSPVWASFPGNTYGQPTKQSSSLKRYYASSLSSAPSPANIAASNATPTQVQPIGQSSGWQVENPRGAKVKGYSGLTPHHTYQTAYDGREVRDFTIFKDGKYANVPVPSPVSGKVTWTGYLSGGGNWVEIVSNAGKVELGHFSKILVTKGQQISAGTILGLQGKTGRATGVHVHIQAPSKVIRDYVNSLASGTSPTGGMVEMPSLAPEDISSQPGQVQSLPPVEPISSVLFIDDRGDTPQVPDMSAAPQSTMAPPTVDQANLLNNFIKNVILSDLAYT